MKHAKNKELWPILKEKKAASRYHLCGLPDVMAKGLKDGQRTKGKNVKNQSMQMMIPKTKKIK